LPPDELSLSDDTADYFDVRLRSGLFGIACGDNAVERASVLLRSGCGGRPRTAAKRRRGGRRGSHIVVVAS